MSVYIFKAKNMSGKSLSGEINAENEVEARVRIRAQHLVPVSIKAKGGSAKKTNTSNSKFKVQLKELRIFTRQFAVLISSGVPILQSIESMVSGTKSPGLINVLNDITLKLNKGKRLYECMALHPTVFDKMYVNLVRAGEEGGVLEQVLKRLAEYIEKAMKLRGKVKGAMVYPVIIISVAIIVITAIMVFVIPSFVEMFEQNNVELPYLTRMVIGASDFTVDYWYVLAGALFGFLAGIKTYYETDPGRLVIDKYILKIPFLGNVIQKGAIAAFSRTMATMLQAGVRIGESLEISSTTVGNVVIENSIIKAKHTIEKGKNLTDHFKNDPNIPVMVTQMISIGEQTGNLDTMLEKIADFFEDEVETAVDAMTSMMEPLLMIVLGGIIAVLVIAMYLPIFKMAEAVM